MSTRFPPLTDGPPDGAVVTGVGLDTPAAALRFAAREATLLGRPLHLLHVLRVSATQAYPAVHRDVMAAADEALERSRALAVELTGDTVPVTAERIDDGWLVGDLVHRTESAHLLVLQHRRLNRWQRLVTGSTVTGVAARSVVPVVSVPDDWTPHPADPPVVTVGVQTPEEAEPLITEALELAAQRGACVRVLHAWWLYGGYDSVVSDRAFAAEQGHEFRTALAPTLARVRSQYPSLPVSVHVRHDTPPRALLEAAIDSELLVLGRRHHLLPLGSHLGSVTRAVLRDAAGPVLVSPEMPLPVTERSSETGRAGRRLRTPRARPVALAY